MDARQRLLVVLLLLSYLLAPATAAQAGGRPGNGPGQRTLLGAVFAWGNDGGGTLGDGTLGNPTNSATPTASSGLSGVVDVKAGLTHSLALKADGTVLAWGTDEYGQLGDGTVGSPINSATPAAVTGLSGIIAIAAGARHNLALKADGTVLAWGWDAFGQLGDGTKGTPTLSPTPTVVLGVRGVVAIAAGGDHSLALNADGTVLAWGSDTGGQVGDGTVANPDANPTPAVVAGVSNAVAVAGGTGFSLVLKADGTLLAWGDDSFAQLGDGTIATPSVNPTPQVVPGVSGITAIAAGYVHALALTSNGTLLAWGQDSFGQLGDGTTGSPINNPTPTPIPGVSGIVAISASNHNLALKADGTVLAWGQDLFGNLGDGTVGSPTVVATPTPVVGLSGVVAIAAGGAHSLAIQAATAAFTWGHDTDGQLGDGTVGSPDNLASPTILPSLSGVVAIAAGGSHTLALKADGTLLAWGSDLAGQLGDGTIGSPESNPTPKAIPGVSGIIAVAAGSSHSLALMGNGTLLAWGSDVFGQLGDGAAGVGNPTPTSVPGVSGIVAIAANSTHNLALKSDGTLLAWGDDFYGEMGDGVLVSPVENPTPTVVAGVSGVRAIAAGSYFNLALKADGTLLAWGDDSDGQLGDGTVGSPDTRPTPAAVPGVGGVATIAAGGAHSLALKTDGTLLTWGWDSYGQLGDGTIGGPTDQPTPTAVSGLSGIRAIAAGSHHTLALQANGTALAWGDNADGQLGGGTVGDPVKRPTPTAIPALSGVATIAAGSAHSLALASGIAPAPSPSPSPSSNPSPSPAASPSPSPITSPSPSPSPTPCGQMFTDVAASNPACQAIEGLAARGVINGCFTDPATQAKDFCPTDPTLRHQMAALIARAMPGWVDETGLPTFGDNTADIELMTRVATLQRHNVVRGYQAAVCAERNIPTPPGCYGPLDQVKYGQVLLFIARAMVEKGYWTLQADDRTVFPDQNGPVGADPDTDQQTKDHRAVVTYVHYVTTVPDVADVHANFVLANGQGWGDSAPRAWFARAFWPALQEHFGQDLVP